MEKRCCTCEVEKPLGAFGPDARASDGLKPRCRDCANAWKRARSSEEKRIERNLWRNRNREQYLAHKAVLKAVKRGTLVRPGACEACGSAGAVQAHHEDYERRFDVQWLCVVCHTGEHMAQRVRVDMRLPEGLLKRLDEARGDVNRTRFVERALEQALTVRAVSSSAEQAARSVPAPKRAAPQVPGLVRASSLVKDPAALARQQKLNEGR